MIIQEIVYFCTLLLFLSGLSVNGINVNRTIEDAKLMKCSQHMWRIYPDRKSTGKGRIVFRIPYAKGSGGGTYDALLACEGLVVNGTGSKSFKMNKMGRNNIGFKVYIPEIEVSNDLEEPPDDINIHKCTFELRRRVHRLQRKMKVYLECTIDIKSVITRLVPHCNKKRKKQLIKSIRVMKRDGTVMIIFKNSANNVVTVDHDCPKGNIFSHNTTKELSEKIFGLNPLNSENLVQAFEFYPDCDSFNSTVRKLYMEKRTEDCSLQVYYFCQNGMIKLKDMDVDLHDDAMYCYPPKTLMTKIIESGELKFRVESKPVVVLIWGLIFNGILYIFLFPFLMAKIILAIIKKLRLFEKKFHALKSKKRHGKDPPPSKGTFKLTSDGESYIMETEPSGTGMEYDDVETILLGNLGSEVTPKAMSVRALNSLIYPLTFEVEADVEPVEDEPDKDGTGLQHVKMEQKEEISRHQKKNTRKKNKQVDSDTSYDEDYEVVGKNEPHDAHTSGVHKRVRHKSGGRTNNKRKSDKHKLKGDIHEADRHKSSEHKSDGRKSDGHKADGGHKSDRHKREEQKTDGKHKSEGHKSNRRKSEHRSDVHKRDSERHKSEGHKTDGGHKSDGHKSNRRKSKHSSGVHERDSERLKSEGDGGHKSDGHKSNRHKSEHSSGVHERDSERHKSEGNGGHKSDGHKSNRHNGEHSSGVHERDSERHKSEGNGGHKSDGHKSNKHKSEHRSDVHKRDSERHKTDGHETDGARGHKSKGHKSNRRKSEHSSDVQKRDSEGYKSGRHKSGYKSDHDVHTIDGHKNKEHKNDRHSSDGSKIDKHISENHIPSKLEKDHKHSQSHSPEKIIHLPLHSTPLPEPESLSPILEPPLTPNSSPQENIEPLTPLSSNVPDSPKKSLQQPPTPVRMQNSPRMNFFNKVMGRFLGSKTEDSPTSDQDQPKSLVLQTELTENQHTSNSGQTLPHNEGTVSIDQKVLPLIVNRGESTMKSIECQQQEQRTIAPEDDRRQMKQDIPKPFVDKSSKQDIALPKQPTPTLLDTPTPSESLTEPLIPSPPLQTPTLEHKIGASKIQYHLPNLAVPTAPPPPPLPNRSPMYPPALPHNIPSPPLQTPPVHNPQMSHSLNQQVPFSPLQTPSVHNPSQPLQTPPVDVSNSLLVLNQQAPSPPLQTPSTSLRNPHTLSILNQQAPSPPLQTPPVDNPHVSHSLLVLNQPAPSPPLQTPPVDNPHASHSLSVLNQQAPSPPLQTPSLLDPQLFLSMLHQLVPSPPLQTTSSSIIEPQTSPLSANYSSASVFDQLMPSPPLHTPPASQVSTPELSPPKLEPLPHSLPHFTEPTTSSVGHSKAELSLTDSQLQPGKQQISLFSSVMNHLLSSDIPLTQYEQDQRVYSSVATQDISKDSPLPQSPT